MIFRICLTLSFVLNFTLASSQEISTRDSLIQLIENEEVDQKKYEFIVKLIFKGGLEEEVLDHYVQLGLLISKKVEEHRKQDTILRFSAIQYLNLGKNEKSLKQYKLIDSLAIQYNDILLEGLAKIGYSVHEDKSGNADKAIALTKEAIVIFKDEKSFFDVSNAYNMLISYYRKKGELGLALLAADSSQVYIPKIHKNERQRVNQLKTVCYSNKGNIYRGLGNNEMAKTNFLLAESEAQILEDKSYLSTIYNNLGNVSQVAGNFEEAIQYYLKSIDIKQQTNNLRGLAIGYHNLGAIEFDIGDFKSAKKYIEQSQVISKAQNYKALIVYNYNKLGSTFKAEGILDSSEINYSSAKELSKIIKFPKGELTALSGLGEVHMILENFELAKSNYFDALKIAQKLSSKPQESSLLAKIAELYILSKKNNIVLSGFSESQIKEALVRGLELSNEMENPKNQMENLKALSLFYKSKNNYKENSETLEKYISIRDTFFDKERIFLTKELETKFETAEKEKEIIQLEAANKINTLKSQKQKSLFFYIISFLLGSVLLGYQLLKSRTKSKQRKQKDLFRSNLSAELHDDVGTILTGLAMQSELLALVSNSKNKDIAEKISTMSRSAMDKMRDTVWAIDARKDTIGDLSDRMLDFSEEVLAPKNISIFFEKTGFMNNKNISPEIRQNIYLIFKEAITNVAKHSNAENVKIDLSFTKNNLSMLISDDGTIIKNHQFTSGNGLSNIKMRVDKLKGKLKINSRNGFSIFLFIPTS